MSYWIGDPTPRTASILWVLQDLEEKYEEPVRRAAGEEKEELTEDDLDTKNRLLARLESILLPSLQNQLSSYLMALDIQHGPEPKYPNPNFDIICEILSKLEATLDETQECIDFAALNIIPIGTHDHQLKQLKKFRCTQLMSSISHYAKDFQMMFMVSRAFIRASQDLSNYPENPECQKKMLTWKMDVTSGAAMCNNSIAKTFKTFQGSDFEIIQDEWKNKAKSLDSTVRSLTEIMRFPTIPRRTNSAVQEQILGLAKSNLPIAKLARMFCREFSKSSRQKFPFKLDTELNSDTLFQLHRTIEEVAVTFRALTGAFTDSYNFGFLFEHQTSIRNHIQKISQTLDSTLLLLAIYLIPLPSETKPFSPRNQYKARFAAWQEVWHRAINNFLTALQSFVDQHHF
ncbi:hypothetical protein Pst134EA_014970 [Puccinia striiformis f. sp. tritici]|uniref:hypothetical protein n=1 Tax=Puccinia striiformis f. sp. tritici TaxID=168172 RepID=UPI0020077961|nr:hypothetical protein Pst134EA_014970 [Puccinia striiformis f. sp. tritici]KAH9462881.1 hypothetical protein Pst134EA_014970 [Puccinia striiformis f. sp. tritici]